MHAHEKYALTQMQTGKVCMEVVSPKLDTMRGVSPIISDFWEAMRVHFKPQEDVSCGGHVHVTPVNLKNKFSLRTLKKIAFATVVYEDYVAAILPAARRDNHYCRLNSQSLDSGLNKTLGWGKSVGTLRKVAAEIRSQSTKADLCHYMQGNRYVLWNFQNIYPHRRRRRCTGTIEFRGGNQFLNTKGTLAWVAFVLGFITLAKEEDLLNNFCSYVPPTDPSWPRRVKDWWKRIREAAKQSRMSRHLPATYAEMQTK
ncbi:hypothetical protein THARTR1_04157 [Trichoderma harzianum]|uniref:Amidoligase enzyme n=1 Tax=Trichoderma harzianum TaxID=5544 RepID=A0A2K0UCY5_TRIHA|nr:hypothetical protein THARTR1_04157 [Trichoderma harzianum]